MVPANILQRVHRIRVKHLQATAFILDHGSNRYLVTARHVALHAADAGRLSVYRAGTWVDVDVTLTGYGGAHADIAVFQAPDTLGPFGDRLEAGGTHHYFLSQEAFIVGFPFGLHSSTVGAFTNGHPVAFVKRATIGAFDSEGGVKRLYLDTHNNEGFSGGPVVVSTLAYQPGMSRRLLKFSGDSLGTYAT